MKAPDPSERPRDATLATVAALIYLASTIVRGWYVLVAHHPRHHVTSDVVPLLGLAERLATSPEAQTLADTIWPPGTSAVLGAFMTLDASLGVAALAQVVVGALVPLFISDAARVMLGPRAGLIALVFASLHFGLIHYGGLFLSEQLFQGAIALGVWTSVVALHLAEPDAGGRGPRPAILALLGGGCGVAWALASTFRSNALPTALAVGGALAVHALRGRRRGLLAMLGAGLLAFALALAPLAVRCSALKAGGFCPVSSNVAMNMALGQSGELGGLNFVAPAGDQTSTTWMPPSLLQHGYGGLGTVPASIYDTRGVLRWLGGRFVAEPGRFVVRAVGNMLDLFRLEYWPDDDGVGAERLVMVAKQLFFLVVIAPALVALAAAIRMTWRTRTLSTSWCFVLAVVGAILGTAALSMGEARYRLPFDGVLILCAASLVADGERRATAAELGALGPRRTSARAFALVAFAALACATAIGTASSPRGRALVALQRLVARRPARAAAAVVRPASDFATPRAPGSAWDAPGNHTFACDPGCAELRLTFAHLERGAALEVSLDNNDRYELVFYRGAQAVARANIDARPGAAGLRLEAVAIPRRAREDGFDAVGVRPLYGDGVYALGHLRLVDAAP